MKFRLIASGEYPYTKTFPPSLREALCIEIQKHMEAYGLKSVVVEVQEDAAPA